MLFDDISEMIKANKEEIAKAKSDFLARFGEMVRELEKWKETCLKKFDGLGIEEDINWALERLESNRFQKDPVLSFGFDRILTCSRIEEISSLLHGVSFEMCADSILALLPLCFRVENRLKILRKPPENLSPGSIKSPKIDLKVMHQEKNTDLNENLAVVNENLTGLMRILDPNFEFKPIFEGEEAEIRWKSEIVKAVSQSGLALETVKGVFMEFRRKLRDIKKEIGSEEDDQSDQKPFLIELERVQDVILQAVTDMNGISRTLESDLNLSLIRQTLDITMKKLDSATREISEIRLENAALERRIQAFSTMSQANIQLQEDLRISREEGKTMKMSMAAGLEESVRDIIEDAKGRIKRSEEVGKTALEEAEARVVKWTIGLKEKMADVRTELISPFQGFGSASSLEAAGAFLISSDSVVLSTTQKVFISARDYINNGLHRLIQELEGLLDKRSGDLTELMKRYQNAIDSTQEIPSFQMFLSTITSEIQGQNDLISACTIDIRKEVENSSKSLEELRTLMTNIQKKVIKKKDRLSAYAQCNAIITSSKETLGRINVVQKRLSYGLSESLRSFEEASHDLNFQRLEEYQTTMRQKKTELTKAVQDLLQGSAMLKGEFRHTSDSYVSYITSQFESVQTNFQEHENRFRTWTKDTLEPVLEGIEKRRKRGELLIEELGRIVDMELDAYREKIRNQKTMHETETGKLKKQYPDDIPVKPILLSEGMTGLIHNNERLHDELVQASRQLSDSVITLQQRILEAATSKVEGEVQMSIASCLSRWAGRVPITAPFFSVSLKGKLPCVHLQSLDVPVQGEAKEVIQALALESEFAREKTLLKRLLPTTFDAVPMKYREVWEKIETRLTDLLALSTSEANSSELVLAEMSETAMKEIVTAWWALAQNNQPKAILWMRIFGLEEEVRTVPEDFGVVLKYMKTFKALTDPYLFQTSRKWKKASQYQLSTGGEALLDEVLTRYAQHFPGETWFSFLKFCKPVSVSETQFVLFLINWKLYTDTYRREAPLLWDDSPTSVVPIDFICSSLASYLSNFLPVSLLQTTFATLGPLGFIEKSTLQACIGRGAYMSLMKDERYVVRTDMFLLGILEAHFSLQRINVGKLAELYEKTLIREGKFTREAFESALRLIDKDVKPNVRQDLFDEAMKMDLGQRQELPLCSFLRVMIRHKFSLFVHQMQVI